MHKARRVTSFPTHLVEDSEKDRHGSQRSGARRIATEKRFVNPFATLLHDLRHRVGIEPRSSYVQVEARCREKPRVPDRSSLHTELEQHSTFALCSFQRRTLEGSPLPIFYYVKSLVMDGESGYTCEICGKVIFGS